MNTIKVPIKPSSAINDVAAKRPAPASGYGKPKPAGQQRDLDPRLADKAQSSIRNDNGKVRSNQAANAIAKIGAAPVVVNEEIVKHKEKRRVNMSEPVSVPSITVPLGNKIYPKDRLNQSS